MCTDPLPFRSYLPIMAYCYFSPKLHKVPISHRPIVSQRRTFTSNLARRLSSILTPLLGSFSPAHLRDSTHLKSLLLEKADPSLPFISLDVDALFTNVPLEPLLGFLHRKHDQGGLPLPPGYTILGFLELIRLCVGTTVFSFNGKFFRQLQGVTMGSPLAPVLACLYMEFFETELLQTIPGPKPTLWLRYIDDVITQWRHSMDEFHAFLDKLNNLESLINFKFEIETPHTTLEGQAVMPFLDVNIHRSPNNFEFSIYRKPTASDSYTHWYSAHTTATKKGIIQGLGLRAHRLCSKDYIGNEIQHLRSVFLKHKYPLSFINEALATAKRKFHEPVPRVHVKAPYHLHLPSHPSLTQLRPALRKIGISTSFSSSNTLRSQLSHTGPIPSRDKDMIPGVYRVDCKQCPEVYFGETGINVKTRRNQHRNDIGKGVKSNALFVHMEKNEGHSFNLDGMSLVYKSNEKPSRQLIESSFIACGTTCNLKPGDFPTCKISAPIVLQCLKLESSIPNTSCPAELLVPVPVSHPTPPRPPALPLPLAPLVPAPSPNPAPAPMSLPSPVPAPISLPSPVPAPILVPSLACLTPPPASTTALVPALAPLHSPLSDTLVAQLLAPFYSPSPSRAPLAAHPAHRRIIATHRPHHLFKPYTIPPSASRSQYHSHLLKPQAPSPGAFAPISQPAPLAPSHTNASSPAVTRSQPHRLPKVSLTVSQPLHSSLTSQVDQAQTSNSQPATSSQKYSRIRKRLNLIQS